MFTADLSRAYQPFLRQLYLVGAESLKIASLYTDHYLMFNTLLPLTALVLSAFAGATAAECPEARCYPSSADSAPPFASEREAIMSGRCLSACILEVCFRTLLVCVVVTLCKC